MNPTDVTNEMVANTCEAVGSFAWDSINRSEIIAAAVNAFLGDPTPITAEWLVKNGYVKSASGVYFHGPGGGTLYYDKVLDYFRLNSADSDHDAMCVVKTIGQLRALEIGLGITP